MSSTRRTLLCLSTALAFATANAQAQEQTARLVKDINRTPGDFHADIQWITPLGNGVVFAMDTLAHGSELWTSDGTPGGTHLLKDVLPGPSSSHPDDMTPFAAGQKIAFHSERLGSGSEVWITDGTEAGTVQAFKAPSPGVSADLYLDAGTTTGVFFNYQDGYPNGDVELYFTDGTAAGTWPLNPVVGESRARFSNPIGFVTSGQWCFFIANDHEIWRSDGTEAGTTRLFDLTEASPHWLKLAGDRLFIQLQRASGVRELWSCSLEGGDLTRLNVPEDTSSSWLVVTATAGNELIMMRLNSNGGSHKLWASDGSAAGTRPIPLLPPDQDSESTPSHSLTSWKGAAYFAADGPDGRDEVWRTDGTSAGTIRLISFPKNKGNLAYLRPVVTEDYLYFHTLDYLGNKSLWRTKGDIASTRPVKRTPKGFGVTSGGTPGSGLFFTAGQSPQDGALWWMSEKSGKSLRLTRPEKSNASAFASQYDVVLPYEPYEMFGGGVLVFADNGGGYELWRMNADGRQARAIWKPRGPLDGTWKFDFHGTTTSGALFTLDDEAGVHQVWITDGTRRGTRLLANHGEGGAGDDYYARPQDFVKVGDTWYYLAISYGDRSKSRLWKTDGTPEGTSMILSEHDGYVASPDAGQLAALGDHVYFLSGRMLWRSDGTQADTVPLWSSWDARNGESASSLTAAGGTLLFTLYSRNGHELWKSDGTAEGTRAMNPPAFFDWKISPAFDLDGLAIFETRQADGPNEWWRLDENGASPVKSDVTGLEMHSWDIDPRWQAAAGGRLFYCGYASAHLSDIELWATDGTDAGTRLVRDINAGPIGSSPDEMLAVGNQIYFTADDGVHGPELWRSDGTEAGTVLVADIDPGSAGSWPRGLKAMNGKLYFNAERRDIGRELFVIDLPE